MRFLRENLKKFGYEQVLFMADEASVATVTTKRMVTVILHSQLITSQIDTANLANSAI
jgi:hypothetical protein